MTTPDYTFAKEALAAMWIDVRLDGRGIYNVTFRGEVVAAGLNYTNARRERDTLRARFAAGLKG